VGAGYHHLSAAKPVWEPGAAWAHARWNHRPSSGQIRTVAMVGTDRGEAGSRYPRYQTKANYSSGCRPPKAPQGRNNPAQGERAEALDWGWIKYFPLFSGWREPAIRAAPRNGFWANSKRIGICPRQIRRGTSAAARAGLAQATGGFVHPTRPTAEARRTWARRPGGGAPIPPIWRDKCARFGAGGSDPRAGLRRSH
jgi:hypothetical protein